MDSILVCFAVYLSLALIDLIQEPDDAKKRIKEKETTGGVRSEIKH